MTPKLRLGMIAAFAVLAVAAVAGWLRSPSSSQSSAAAAPSAAAPIAPAPYDQYGQADSYAAAPAPGYEETAALPSYATTHYVRVIRSEPPPPAEPVYQDQPYAESYGEADRAYEPAPGVHGGPRYVETRRARHHRSVGKSVAIVAGSAGVGAAIGGIAGGGKGAGIGALAGGAGGFIYDRLTHH
jgi:hypothetical protein